MPGSHGQMKKVKQMREDRNGGAHDTLEEVTVKQRKAGSLDSEGEHSSQRGQQRSGPGGSEQGQHG